MKFFLASALLLVSGFACGQNDVRPEDTPKDDCPSCLAKTFRGQLAPDFDLPTLGGEKLKLSSLRGQAVLLNFWCRCGGHGASNVQIPMLIELQNEYGPQGLQVIGVSLDDYATTEEISDYGREMNLNYPIVIGKTSSFEKKYYGVFFLPMTYFIDREGRVIAREIGVGSRSGYAEIIRRSLGLDADRNRTPLAVTSPLRALNWQKLFSKDASLRPQRRPEPG
jgi:peroxiredoxin